MDEHRLRWFGRLAFAGVTALLGLSALQLFLPSRLEWSAPNYEFEVLSGQTQAQTFTLSHGGLIGSKIAIELTGSSAFSIGADGCTGTTIGGATRAPACVVTIDYTRLRGGVTGDNAVLEATDVASGALPPAAAVTVELRGVCPGC